jgi:branched-chain amino acid transport system permease protein
MFGLDSTIAAILTLDGVTSGVIYGLIAIALVLVFAVTRILFLPQGEFVTFGALTLAMLQDGRTPGSVWLLLALAVCATATELFDRLRHARTAGLAQVVLKQFIVPVAIAGLAAWAAPRHFPLAVQAVIAMMVVTAMGPLLYRVIYESIADASVLVLLIVSVGVHLAMTSFGLLFFGAEGFRTPSLLEERWSIGGAMLSGQTVVVVLAALILLIALWLFSERTLYGKALRATAVNRLGAQLMGISTSLAGRLSFAIAAFIGALSGVLIGPLTTVFYDSGFLIGLKGFVAATIGGLASYPLAAAGSLFVGLLESFSSFWASDYKEVVVFMSLIPVLLWRSFASPVHLEEEE